MEDGVFEDPTQGLLKFVAHGIAYRAIRNRGTMGGSLAHADPAADWVSTLAALGAVIVAQGTAKQPKRYAAETFVEGAFMTKLGENEVIVSIEVPRLSTAAKWAYHKINRKTGEFANAIGIAILDQKAGLTRVLAGAVDGPPIVLPKTADRLNEMGWEAASKTVSDELAEIAPDTDIEDRELHAVAVRRALKQLGQEHD
ncbi:FAD binding domain-containing protein [Bradyrhizobium sp. Ai1a-2]|uniref:FAD binding domain-containing protein n=1 Tax=Bradyrhizobium sp. Ai1a-2 TaxID=196490 RepID=UPI001FCB3E67|nr:FAD binding domain-containing protein [Bradyrhizobium sp. Ai1a-2]